MNTVIKRVVLFCMVLLVANPSTVFGREIETEASVRYREYLEWAYGFSIGIDDSILNKDIDDPFYKWPFIEDPNVEWQVLASIETAFKMLPEGFVSEIASHYKSKNQNPKIRIRAKNTSDNGDVAGLFTSDASKAELLIVNGNSLIETLLHEFGHAVFFALDDKKAIQSIKTSFNEYNQSFPYNENYKRLAENEQQSNSGDVYFTAYSSKNFEEDFAETFAYGITQYRYTSSYGNGSMKPIHYKILKISEVLSNHFETVKGTNFLLNNMPDPPAPWAAHAVFQAKSNNIIPWGIYGLNTKEITKYDLALILQPYLFKRLNDGQDQQSLPKKFVYDIADSEDIYLLREFNILAMDKDDRFNPGKKIERQAAAVSLAKVAQLLGIQNSLGNMPRYNDSGKIAGWAKEYVDFVTALKLMSVDSNGNFNPTKFVTYQEMYIILLRLSEMVDKNKSTGTAPNVEYYQTIGEGTTLADNGWIYFNSPLKKGFSGTGRYVEQDGRWYEGHWLYGKFTGKARVVYSNKDYYEGGLKDDQRSGNGKYVSVKGWRYDGEWRNDKMWGKGKYQWENGLSKEGYWKEDAYVGD